MKLRKHIVEDGVAVDRGDRVAVVGDDEVGVRIREVDIHESDFAQALDRFGRQVLACVVLVRGGRDLAEEGAPLLGIGDMRRREDRKRCDAVEDAAVLGAIDPRLVFQDLWNLEIGGQADHVDARVLELGRAAVDGLVADHRGQLHDRHGRYQVVVFLDRPVGELGDLVLRVELYERCGELDASLREPARHLVPDGARAACLRELERGVRAPGHVIATFGDVSKHALDVHLGNPVAEPGVVHLRRVNRPDLLVVGNHEVLCDAFACSGEDPLLEVGDRRRGAFVIAELEKSIDALLPLVMRKVADVVLEGIGDEGPVLAHPGHADVVIEAVGQEAVHQLVDVVVMRVGDMDRDVPGESLFVIERRGEAADVVVGVVDFKIRVAQFVQSMCRAESAGPGADDDNSHSFDPRGRVLNSIPRMPATKDLPRAARLRRR